LLICRFADFDQAACLIRVALAEALRRRNGE
jgi:hypothetical protein